MASVRVTVPDEHVQTVLAAVGAAMGKEGNATAAEVREFLANYLRATVYNVRRSQAERAALEAVDVADDIEITAEAG